MKMITLTIDGHKIETTEEKSVMQAALDTGIYIPHICSHDDLKPAGACRLCVVEIEGVKDVVTSCSTPVQEGMVVTTRSPHLKQMRRLAAELLLTSHPSECTSCIKFLNCELQSLLQYLEVTDQRIRKRVSFIPVDKSNPLVMHDMQRCILCGRCVRACGELRGIGAITFVKKDGKTRVGTKNGESLANAGCKFCGSCIEVCPTGSILDQEGLIKPDANRKDALVPCRETCPAGIDVPRFIRFIREGEYSASAAVIREKVPFPSVLGHICNHPCEFECRREKVNSAISIKELKLFAAEHDDKQWKAKSVQMPPSGKKVAIIGSGPAGLTSAYYLAKLGHSVTLFESLSVVGGMMRVGIPKYRLPWEVLDEEIAEICSVGVEIKLNTRIDSASKLLEEGYNAVLAAVGTHQGAKLPIPGSDLEGVLLNTTFLREVSLGAKVEVGERVVVLGGGNVAFDCAGVALRLGAKDVHIACLEARNEMKASEEEVQEALDEGITIHPSVTFSEITGENGKVTGVKCSKIGDFRFDENGKPVMECEVDSEHILPADTVIFAVGQRPEIDESFGLLLTKGNRIAVNEETFTSSVEGVFAAGDVITGTASVIEGIAAGRKVAMSIDKYLGGNGIISEELAPLTEPNAWLGRDEGFAETQRCESRCTSVEQRLQGFKEVNLGYDQDNALKESQRCLQCDLRLRITEQKFWSEYTS